MTCEIIFVQFRLSENYFTRIFFFYKNLHKIKANYGILFSSQIGALGQRTDLELSWDKCHFCRCTEAMKLIKTNILQTNIFLWAIHFPIYGTHLTHVLCRHTCTYMCIQSCVHLYTWKKAGLYIERL